ncbi:hypothetical protein FA95DRAFT_761738 [Auriscalpium vulgare]|uniref:Uncharacterized protein n=1 Tax=Auriscalpium vulgare TaxID=40419 RepID=A0ACB8S1U8_9AGAM|nr:hypothetical protein FA95DRAFT_761738 [Auriscalpium vulgare]
MDTYQYIPSSHARVGLPQRPTHSGTIWTSGRVIALMIRAQARQAPNLDLPSQGRMAHAATGHMHAACRRPRRHPRPADLSILRMCPRRPAWPRAFSPPRRHPPRRPGPLRIGISLAEPRTALPPPRAPATSGVHAGGPLLPFSIDDAPVSHLLFGAMPSRPRFDFPVSDLAPARPCREAPQLIVQHTSTTRCAHPHAPRACAHPGIARADYATAGLGAGI